MKKIGLFISLVLTLILMLTSMAFASNPPLEVDIEALEGNAGTADIHIFSAAGYSDFILQMGKIGDYISLGEIDLSKYDTVTLYYGADGGAVFYDDTKNAWLALTKNGPTTDTSYNPKEGVEIISQVNLENPDGSWVAGSVELTMSLDTDYNGEVFMALTMAKIGDRQDGIAITEIVFSDSTFTTPTPEPTEEPTATPVRTPTTPPTATKAPADVDDKDGSSLPLIIGGIAAAVVVIAVIVVLVIKKKK